MKSDHRSLRFSPFILYVLSESFRAYMLSALNSSSRTMPAAAVLFTRGRFPGTRLLYVSYFLPFWF